ncbi:GDSL-type esterase/lipase family protein [uncultured Muriicola sp.]|uniref:GDSL-type esterase/lipase family protein n=1 Tax=uncultured Muriicola sp. TaxID=1583102 RepID=UPI00261AD9BC|nr:GDSL-type esterase/lipase family protein [uncultured Muriicola sp.]
MIPTKLTYFLLLFGSLAFLCNAQKAEDFTEEVSMMAGRYDSIWDENKATIVFTGSSSVRLWEGLEDLFPDHQIINTGFGGSQTRDLLKHLQPLVLSYKPKMVFIYEGDNDINFKKRPNRVIRITRKIIDKIWQHYPETEVVLISTKPSIVRWHLKKRYIKLNLKFKEYAEQSPQIAFANVWDVMLKNEIIDESLFIEDGLHMNQKGYDLWYEVIKPFIN